jgi:hypothetical protein
MSPAFGAMTALIACLLSIRSKKPIIARLRTVRWPL